MKNQELALFNHVSDPAVSMRCHICGDALDVWSDSIIWSRWDVLDIGWMVHSSETHSTGWERFGTARSILLFSQYTFWSKIKRGIWHGGSKSWAFIYNLATHFFFFKYWNIDWLLKQLITERLLLVCTMGLTCNSDYLWLCCLKGLNQKDAYGRKTSWEKRVIVRANPLQKYWA